MRSVPIYGVTMVVLLRVDRDAAHAARRGARVCCFKR